MSQTELNKLPIQSSPNSNVGRESFGSKLVRTALWWSYWLIILFNNSDCNYVAFSGTYFHNKGIKWHLTGRMQLLFPHLLSSSCDFNFIFGPRCFHTSLLINSLIWHLDRNTCTLEFQRRQCGQRSAKSKTGVHKRHKPSLIHVIQDKKLYSTTTVVMKRLVLSDKY